MRTAKPSLTCFTVTLSVDAHNNKTGVISHIKHRMTEDTSFKSFYTTVRTANYCPNGINSIKVVNQLKKYNIISPELHQQLQEKINYIPQEKKSTESTSFCAIL